MQNFTTSQFVRQTVKINETVLSNKIIYVLEKRMGDLNFLFVEFCAFCFSLPQIFL